MFYIQMSVCSTLLVLGSTTWQYVRSCIQGKTELLRYSILNQIGVAGDSSDNLSTSKLVEEGNVLAQHCSEVLFANLLRAMFADVDESNGCNVRGDEFGNCQVDEIENVMAKSVRKVIVRLFALKVVGEHAG
jgi:hypothetical protein